MPIQPLRKTFVWHNAPEIYKNIPGFVITHKSHSYYGFPSDGIGLKVGKHNGGQYMQSLDEFLPYGAVAEDKTELLECLCAFLRGAGEAVHGEACSYDMSPDENFIIDVVPNIPNVMVVSGLSGHGFKFTSALGEVAALFGGGKESPIELSAFRLSRFKKSSQL
ncbi:hypothetical protein O3G_MSEX000688 [Manduca sexta]|nr:hypothetical protein O3G_MSEX000688 [Manduca sexta]